MKNIEEKKMVEKDPGDLENEKWNPTSEALQNYLSREVELAQYNLRNLLRESGMLSFKQLKESTLHSIETMECALSREIADNRVTEVAPDRFSLVR